MKGKAANFIGVCLGGEKWYLRFRSNKYRTWERLRDGLGGGVKDGGIETLAA